ncbi:MAG: helix-turn-helix domain-containing protein [Myxococcota bacterium]
MKKRSQLVGYLGAAEITGIPVNTLYTYVHRRKIPHLRIGPRLVRFDVNELEAWLNEKRCGAIEVGL